MPISIGWAGRTLTFLIALIDYILFCVMIGFLFSGIRDFTGGYPITPGFSQNLSL